MTLAATWSPGEPVCWTWISTRHPKMGGRTRVRGVVDGVAGPLTSEDGVQFWPIRPTAARSLRPSDEILVHEHGWPDTTRRGPQTGLRGRITDIREDESTFTLTVNGELVGEHGLFEKQARPWDGFDRLVQPGEPPPQTESRLVHGEELWKWLQVEVNDPDGSAEKYILRRFRRVHDEELDREVIQVVGQSTWNPRKTNTMTFFPKARIIFDDHR
jgi:hypothetical protein